MKSNTRDGGFQAFFTDASSVEDVRRQFLEAPLEAARQTMFGPALELAQVLRALPDAFAASQRRELKRLKSTAEENDPRVAYLEESIEQADGLRTMARRGEVRAQRSIVAYATGREVFHGFVSDSNLNPVSGLTVQLTAGKDRTGKEPSSVTDSEGYFSIPLGKRVASVRVNEKDGEKLSPEQIAERLAAREKAGNVYQQSPERSIRVEILRDGKLIHEDPVPMEIGKGSAYREYVISEKKYSTHSDFQDFVAQQGEKAESYSADLKADAADVDKPTSPAASQGAKKKATRRASAPKPASKK